MAVRQVVKNTSDPVWKPTEVPLGKLCLGDTAAKLQIEIMDWNGYSAHDLIGVVQASVQDLLQSVGKDLRITKPSSKTPNKDRGMLTVVAAELYHPPTFVDYISGGCEINITVAVDFTASNKHPNDPASLHYRGQGWNKYQQAIIAVGEILEKYSTTKMFTAYGFGAKLPNGQVSHCFELSLQMGNPAVQGVQGILDAYAKCLDAVELYGPTNFHDVIRAGAVAAKQAVAGGRQAYQVLLIITDGAISDMDNTKEIIIESSNHPLSIIIVGVGNADFSCMRELDGDEITLTSSTTGRRCQRDIVQFVAFDTIKSDLSLLAREVLAEVPLQLTSYMHLQRIQPLPRIQISGAWDANLQTVSVISVNSPADFSQPGAACAGFIQQANVPPSHSTYDQLGTAPHGYSQPGSVVPGGYTQMTTAAPGAYAQQAAAPGGYPSISSAAPGAYAQQAAAHVSSVQCSSVTPGGYLQPAAAGFPPLAPVGCALPAAPPPALAAPPPAFARPLPPGWRSGHDPTSGRIYYINDQTRITQWEFPSA